MKLPCDCGEQAELKCDDNGGHDMRVWWMQCDHCASRTVGDFQDANDAIDAWTSATEETEDEEEDEKDETISRLTRMLSSVRDEYDDLRADNGRLIHDHMILQNKYRELVKATSIDPAQERERWQAEVEALQKKLDAVAESHRATKEALKSTAAEARSAYEGNHKLCRELAEYRDTMRELDWHLIDFGCHLANLPDSIKNEVGFLETVLESIILHARKKNFDPKVDPNSNLHRMIQMLSPGGVAQDENLYRKGIWLAAKNDEEGIKSWFGDIMSRYSQRSAPYETAWNALGRPGETRGNYSRPPRRT